MSWLDIDSVTCILSTHIKELFGALDNLIFYSENNDFSISLLFCVFWFKILFMP